MNKQAFTSNLLKNVDLIKSELNSEDIKYYSFKVRTHEATLIYIDSMADKKALSVSVIKPLLSYKGKVTVENLIKNIPSPEISEVADLKTALKEILDGNSLLIIDKLKKPIAVGFKDFETRSIDEPSTSVTLRGPREGFVESINQNISLIRRRIKNKDLIFENMTVGRYSSTKVAVCYVKSIVRNGLPKRIKEKIKSIDIDAVPDSSYIGKFLNEHKTSVFKQMGSTEKPDILSAKIMEGRVAILVDGSPFVLTVPYIIAEDFQSGDDYYSSSYRASIMRILRVISVSAAIYLPAFFVAAQLFHLQLLPLSFLLTIVNSIKGIPLSPSFEMFFTLMIFEILNEASIRMPKYVGMAVSVVGGLVLGETAVNAGIISAPALMIIAISGICLYTVPELVQTFSLLRVIFLCIAGSLGGYGVLLMTVGLITYLVSFESYDTPLLSPFAPLIAEDVKDSLYKGFLQEMEKRPKTFKSPNKTRMKLKKEDKQ